ncbi:MAG: hypothetical protein HDS71_05445 [Bacteroidales bacterium]|nr:hypothetical protein [Bacteroidales bacterium]
MANVGCAMTECCGEVVRMVIAKTWHATSLHRGPVMVRSPLARQRGDKCRDVARHV